MNKIWVQDQFPFCQNLKFSLPDISKTVTVSTSTLKIKKKYLSRFLLKIIKIFRKKFYNLKVWSKIYS